MTTREERVRLTLDDAGFTSSMARAAAAAALLDKTLNGLDGRNVDLGDGLRSTNDDVDRLGTTTRRTSKDIDTFSGRLGYVAKAAAALGPALAPLGAVAVGGAAALAEQLGYTAVAAGTVVLAFQGIGDALAAVDKAQLQPTTANLEAMRVALAGLSPAGRDLVDQLQQMQPVLDGLKVTAQAGLFPGLIDGLTRVQTLAPEVNQIIGEVASTLGDLANEAGADLASSRWSEFFETLATQARPALEDMGHALGSVVHGLGQLWIAFAPLNRDFGGWMADVAKGFDQWATGLRKTEGFQEFLAYIRENGPRVADLVSAVGNALLQIAEAAAPIGGPVLEALTQVANAIAAIADSPLGTPIMLGVSALSALSLAGAAATASLTRLQAGMAAVGVESATMGRLAGMSGGQIALMAYGAINAVESLTDSYSRLTDGNITLGDTMATLFHTATFSTFALDKLGISTQLAGDHSVSYSELLHGVIGTVKDATAQTHGYANAEAEAAAHTQRLKQQQLAQAQAARQQAQAIRESAQSFYTLADAVEKPTLSLDDLETRMRRQAAATRDMADNMRKAIENGADPRALMKMFDELGTQGALALQQLANGGKKAAHEFNASFADSARATHSLESVLDHLANAIDRLNGKKAKPKLDLDDAAFNRKMDLGNHAVDNLDGQRAEPKVDLDGVELAIAQAGTLRGALGNLHDKSITVTTTYVTRRVGAENTPGGTGYGPQPVPQADGGTVPGQRLPYGDKTLIWAAPGEEIITNRNGEADQFRRDRAAGRIPAYAFGGTVGAGVSGPARVDYGVDAWRRALADAGQSVVDLALLFGESAVSIDQARRLELTSRKHHLSELLKLQTREQDAIRERLDALRQERQSIMDGVASLITGSADLLGGVRTPVIPAVGSSGEITWTDAPATFDSFSSALTTQFGTASQLSAVLRKLKHKHIGGAVLSWLIQNGATIQTLEDFANQSAADLQGLSQQFQAVQHATHAAGNLAAGAAGLNAEIRGLRKDYAETKHEIRETNKRLDKVNATLSDMHKRDPERTGVAAGTAAATAVKRYVNQNAADAQRRARR